MQIRRTLAVGALSAIALTGFAGTPAVADIDLSTVDCTTVGEHIATAKDDFTTARLGFQAAHRPMGKLVKAEREQARADAREARANLKTLARELKKTDTWHDSRELVKAMKTERRQLAKAARLARSDKALRAEAMDSRRDAKQTWEDAKDDLRELRKYRATECATDEPEVEDETEVEDGVEDGTEA